MQQPVVRAHTLRRVLLGATLAAGLAVLALQIHRLTGRGVLPINDFVEYWAAGRLNLGGGNPYALDQLLDLQRQVGWPYAIPNVLWYPPYVLPILMPFGLLAFRTGQLVWLTFHLGVVLLCGDWVWRYYGGPKTYRWLAWLISLCFAPTWYALLGGQIGPLLLLGIVGFLYFERRRRDTLAGASILLIAIKPQLLYLFWIAAILWVIGRRRWAVLMGVGLATAGATGTALIVNPSVLSQFAAMIAGGLPAYWVTPTFGAMLRLLAGWDRFWLQFLPMGAGLIWLAFRWGKRRETWSWAEEMPALLLASVITTSYGWAQDHVVLLLPVLRATVWLFEKRALSRAIPVLALYVLANLLGLNAANLPVENYLLHVWVPPLLALCYWLAGRDRHVLGER